MNKWCVLPALLWITFLVSCFHGDLYYIKANGKLFQASRRRDNAITAAAIDAHNFKSIEMLKEMNLVTEEHTKEMQTYMEALKNHKIEPQRPQEEYEESLKFYNKINNIARSYGFGEFAPDFNPNKE